MSESVTTANIVKEEPLSDSDEPFICDTVTRTPKRSKRSHDDDGIKIEAEDDSIQLSKIKLTIKSTKEEKILDVCEEVTSNEGEQPENIKIKIPDVLKYWLVDDWNLVVGQKKLYKLPARVPVETILSDYIKHRVSNEGITPSKEKGILEFTNGIRAYFDVLLGKQLLFKFERAQRQEVMSQNPDSVPSQLYGSFHLLRLFTKIGGAVAYTPLDEDSITLINNHLFEFLKYMSNHSSTLFSLSDYEASSPEYLKKNS